MVPKAGRRRREEEIHMHLTQCCDITSCSRVPSVSAGSFGHTKPPCPFLLSLSSVFLSSPPSCDRRFYIQTPAALSPLMDERLLWITWRASVRTAWSRCCSENYGTPASITLHLCTDSCLRSYSCIYYFKKCIYYFITYLWLLATLLWFSRLVCCSSFPKGMISVFVMVPPEGAVTQSDSVSRQDTETAAAFLRLQWRQRLIDKNTNKKKL